MHRHQFQFSSNNQLDLSYNVTDKVYNQNKGLDIMFWYLSLVGICLELVLKVIGCKDTQAMLGPNLKL